MSEYAEPRRSKPVSPYALLQGSAIALLLLSAITQLPAQSASAKLPTEQLAATAVKLEFEVASIRPTKSNDKSHSTFSLDNGNVYFSVKDDDVLGPSGGYFAAANFPLLRYIVFAYNLTGTQELALRFGSFTGLTTNLPSWLLTEKFDIQARADGHPTKDQVRQMMRSLLEDRFKLAVHTETRQAPVFALVPVITGKTGPHLQPHPAEDSCSTPSSTEPSSAAPNQPSQPATAMALPLVCGVISHLPPSAAGNEKFGGRNVPLSMLASSLPTQTGMATLPRPVIDQTGLSGSFDFSLEWTPEIDGTPDQGDEAGTTFRAALKKQLGLKLEPTKAPVDILVIDHVEHPTEN